MAAHLDPELLRTFVAIVDAGGFTPAASRCIGPNRRSPCRCGGWKRRWAGRCSSATAGGCGSRRTARPCSATRAGC